MKYNIQCTNGHVFAAKKGSAFEKLCKERAERGYLDALIINPRQCEECAAERTERLLAQADAIDAYLRT